MNAENHNDNCESLDSAPVEPTLSISRRAGVQPQGLKREFRGHRLALLGIGEVGMAYYQATEAGLLPGTMITKVVVKDKSKPRIAKVNGATQEVKFARGILTDDFSEVLDNSQIDALVDCSNEPSPGLIEAALRMAIPVVTANKAVIARHGNHLFRLAARQGVALRCEACVCAEVPILGAIAGYHRHHGVRRVRGVLNGTSNFVLSSMERAGSHYHDALHEAQIRGFAEHDPSADVSGADASNKLLILTAFGCGLPLLDVQFHESILRAGIEGILPPAFELARKFSGGQSIKQLAEAINADGEVALRVMPTFVKRDTLIGTIDGARNAVVISKAFGGASEMSGSGAGGEPTASALLADLAKVLGDVEHGVRPSNYGSFFDGPPPRLISPHRQLIRPVFQSVSPEHEVGVLASKLEAIAQAGLSVEQIWNDAASREETVADYIACESCIYEAAQQAVTAMERLKCVSGEVKIFNVAHTESFA